MFSSNWLYYGLFAEHLTNLITITYTLYLTLPYLIKQDGTIFQLVDENNSAYHAGKSYFDGRYGWNKSSIGIEIESFGDIEELRTPDYHLQVQTKKTEHTGAFSEEQYTSLKALLDDIYARHDIKYLLAHSDLAPGRKNDPDEAFDWRKLEELGYKCYLNFDKADKHFSPDLCESDEIYAMGSTGHGVEMLQTLLQDFGYGVEVSGTYDEETARAVVAFKMHYADVGADYTSWSAGDFSIMANLFADNAIELV
jgi:N-acetyl-anhydromuramyl-L-alanine amidase AmpD